MVCLSMFTLLWTDRFVLYSEDSVGKNILSHALNAKAWVLDRRTLYISAGLIHGTGCGLVHAGKHYVSHYPDDTYFTPHIPLS